MTASRPSSLRSLSLLALLLASLALTACGGGGATPDTDHAGAPGTTTMLVENGTGFNGTFVIGGASFPLPADGTLSLSNLTIGDQYDWQFNSVWTSRAGSRVISGVSSNYLYIP